MTQQRESLRLQKFLARAGVASRRAAEDLLRAGRV
ncbi:MAG: S4 domain-containing protein, partial [Anaerolineae bacterium]